MSIALTVLLLLELAAGAVLLLRWRAHRERMAAFETRVAEAAVERPELREAASGAITPPILVEILNAQELAARESWAARRFGALLPRRVGREVAGRAAEQLAAQLAAQGVRADVTVLAPEPLPPTALSDLADLSDLSDLSAGLEEAVAVGTTGVREVHRTISAIPFDLLDGVPPARTVRAVHDRTADGVFDTVHAVNRLAGRLLRRRQ
ncbi:hypothetical protein [Pseudonocardia sp.]|uniref:hypothetical protein n=1 Tax=Pseudonocardia sp. TaxID=60912 RepID=UPI003D13FFD9